MTEKKAAAKKPAAAAKEAPRHQWVKVNLITQKDSTGTFDLYGCSKCDVTFKRRGLQWNPPTKPCEKAKTQLAKLAKPKKPVIKATPAEAKTRTDAIVETFKKMGKMWWELGAEVKKAIDDRVPEALGKSAHEWMEDCFGDSWLKIYRAHRIMKAMSGVDMEKLQKISEGNAYSLARLPEKIRKSPEWIKKAAELGNDKFKEVTDKFIEKKTGIKDPMVKLFEAFGFTTAPKSFGVIVKGAIELAGKIEELDLDTKAGRIHAVEAIFSDYITANQGQAANEDSGIKAGDTE